VLVGVVMSAIVMMPVIDSTITTTLAACETGCITP